MAKFLFVALFLTSTAAAAGGCGSALEHPASHDTNVVDDTAPEDTDAPDTAPAEVDDSVEEDTTTDIDTAEPLDTAPDTVQDTESDSSLDVEPDTNADPCGDLADGTPCDDHNACTHGDRCHAGRCAPVDAVTCDDDNPCTDDTCRPDTGCVHLPNLAFCDDGDPCTTRDRCAAGLCRPGVFACDDHNACTRDTCAADGTCSHVPDDTLACEDGSACTAGDFCQGGTCVSGALEGCTSQSTCTTARCGDDGRTCIYTNLDDLACDDGDACTTGDRCQGGVCRAGPPIHCGWDTECAVFRCDRRDGCILETPFQAGRTCSDDDHCTTGDKCDGAGFCVPSGVMTCDDDNPCTQDTCNPIWGCSHTGIDGPCDDGSLCTTGDACQFGQCRGNAVTCNDQNACTADSCDPLVGCQHLPLRCDDQNPCTTDTCDPSLGCVHTPRAGACDDGFACTTGDTCSDGICVGLSSCDDDDPCTIDLCTANEGCVQVVRDQCPVGLVDVTAVGLREGGAPGFGQWFSLTSTAEVPLFLSGWLVIGAACDCEARLTTVTLQPGATIYGLRASDPVPTPAELAPGGPATLTEFSFQYGEIGDDFFFAPDDLIELVDETGAIVSTFMVE